MSAVCTIAITYFFAPFVEVEYFDDQEPLTAELADFT